VKSYLKDTNHFIQKIKNLDTVPKNAILATIDVTALYTNIPHREGIIAAKQALEKRHTKEPITWIILRFLNFILTKTCFIFNEKYYEQKSGTTMGTKCAPSYAILFMDKLEQDFLNKQNITPLVWWRYIDDIFIIWPNSRQEFDSFLSALNSFHDHIKFTAEIDNERVNFMDVTVSKDKEGKLHTTLFTKPTDAHLYLHYTSYHPTHQRKSIPYSQAIRIRRICSDMDEFKRCTQQLFENLIARGYPKKLVRQAINKASQTDREILINNTRIRNIIPTVPLIVTHNPRNPKCEEILRRHLHLIKEDKSENSLGNVRIITAFRRATNIKQTLVKTSLKKQSDKKGSSACQANCIGCQFMNEKDSIQSHTTKEVTEVTGKYDCTTASVIYIISCKKCGAQYIGQTRNTMRERLYGHLADIRTQNQVKPVSKHFTSNNHTKEDMDLTIITQTSKNNNIRLRTEEVYIVKMKTITPHGLNLIY